MNYSDFQHYASIRDDYEICQEVLQFLVIEDAPDELINRFEAMVLPYFEYEEKILRMKIFKSFRKDE